MSNLLEVDNAIEATEMIEEDIGVVIETEIGVGMIESLEI